MTILAFVFIFMMIGLFFYYRAYKTYERTERIMETLTDMIWREINCVNEGTD